MLEIIEKTAETFASEVVVMVVTIGFAALKRMLEKRKLRRQGKLRDDAYYEDNIRHMNKWD